MLNNYKCLECGKEWEDAGECSGDDECPECGTVMTAHDLDENGNYTPIILTNWQGYLQHLKNSEARRLNQLKADTMERRF